MQTNKMRVALIIAGTLAMGFVGGRLGNSPEIVHAQATHLPPGLEPYTPTKIEWLTLECQAELRDYSSLEGGGYSIDIANPDFETIVIYVQYTPNVIREAMNAGIDGARKVIEMKAKWHGWETWVKVKEQMHPVANLPVKQ